MIILRIVEGVAVLGLLAVLGVIGHASVTSSPWLALTAVPGLLVGWGATRPFKTWYW